MSDLTLTNSRKRNIWVGSFFSLLLLLGLFIYRDYGISLDESISRENGMITLKHLVQYVAPGMLEQDFILNQYMPLEQYNDRDYGIAFETPISLIERLLHIDDEGDQIYFRHLMTFLVCFGGVIAVYQLAARRFRDWRVGLLAALFLVLSPRLFAEAFYNDKDAVFMALFAVATNTGVRFLLRPTVGRAVWHALACAVMIDVRIMGIILPALTLGFLFWSAVRGQVKWPQMLTTGMLYVVLVAGLVVAFWPFLWSAPLDNFLWAFDNMRNFRADGLILYLGTPVSSTKLPWHYPVVWVGATTPLLYVVGFLVGVILIGITLVRQHWRLWQNEQEMQDLLFLALAVGPVLAVIVLHSVLYDGWRQLYFIYPAFLLIAMRGWVAAWQWRPLQTGGALWSRVVLAATVLSVVTVAYQMVRDHPLQNVYFNALAGRHPEEKFEVDYWGLSFRKGLEYIVATDDRPHIAVSAPVARWAGFSQKMLPADTRNRLQFVDNPAEADYFITNYRGHAYSYDYPNEVFQIRANNMRVLSVFRLRW
ncbi:glycosyltransferase family 39 protein [Hymenobacter sp. GOD-10R]|uniref:glycosyltransferase family 39 protein n=1 Tax=Hymenobacter sp. GOD-10R TaxID=3093922 RepID=UPI002D798F71|nr:hypothetical protein [Hymenobacter sp. GOD-10R]WRQ28980.1 hypothetical protein SD425_01720 [Hymenobacter sp. GOD-10R]